MVGARLTCSQMTTCKVVSTTRVGSFRFTVGLPRYGSWLYATALQAELIPPGSCFWGLTTSLHGRNMQGKREAAGGTLLLHNSHMYLQMTQPLAAQWPHFFNDSARVSRSPGVSIRSRYNDTRPKS